MIYWWIFPFSFFLSLPMYICTSTHICICVMWLWSTRPFGVLYIIDHSVLWITLALERCCFTGSGNRSTVSQIRTLFYDRVYPFTARWTEVVGKEMLCSRNNMQLVQGLKLQLHSCNWDDICDVIMWHPNA